MGIKHDVFALVCMLAAPAHAEPSAFTLRLDLPTAGRVDGHEWYEVAGVVLSARIRGPFVAEVAADYHLDACLRGLLFTARAGVAPTIAHHGNWAFVVPALAGVGYGNLNGGGCDQNPDETALTVTAATGLEVHRVPRGFAVRLLVAGGWYGDERFRMPEGLSMYTAPLGVGYAF